MKEIEEELKRTEGNVSLPNQIENCKLCYYPSWGVLSFISVVIPPSFLLDAVIDQGAWYLFC